jgi:hypothetical protein
MTIALTLLALVLLADLGLGLVSSPGFIPAAITSKNNSYPRCGAVVAIGRYAHRDALAKGIIDAGTMMQVGSRRRRSEGRK